MGELHLVKLMRLAARSCHLSALNNAFSHTLSPSKLQSAFFVVITQDLSLLTIAFLQLPLSSTLSPVRCQLILLTLEK